MGEEKMFKWLANLYWKFDFWLSAELKPAGDELKELFKRDIPRTAEELELDKKRKKSEQFWDDSDEMDIYENHLFSDISGNRYNDE